MVAPMLRVTLGGDAIKEITSGLQSGGPAAMKEIGQLLQSEVLETFRTETDPWGVPWAPHSQTTLALRVRGGIGKQPKRTAAAQARREALIVDARLLVDRGTLRAGVQPTSSARRATVRVRGPAKRYALAQQFGNPDNKMPNGAPAPIPARAYMPIRPNGEIDIPPDVYDDILDVLRRHLLKGFK